MSLTRSSVAVLLLLGFFAGSFVLQASGKCLICDSATNPNCISKMEDVTNATFCQRWCFTKVDNGVVTRGCFDDLGEGAEDACVEPACYKCNSENGVCNKHSICKACDSSKDANCAQTDASKAAFNAVCAAKDTKCLMRVKDDHHVERRCALDTDTDTTCTGLCEQCATANCNVGIYPAERRRCYQCNPADGSGSKCADVTANTEIASKPCLLYEEKQQCYVYGYSDTNMTRGCLIDADTTINKCSVDTTLTTISSPLAAAAEDTATGAEEQTICQTCDTDNCNNAKYKHVQSLTCVQCSNDLEHEDTNCKWGQLQSNAKNCANDLLYYQQDWCYTQVNNGSIHRGCRYDRNETELGDCTDENSCSMCNDVNGCNYAALEDFTCIRCRDDEDPLCYNDADKLEGSACTKPVTDPTTGKCYHGIWNGVVIRGCLQDADNRMQIVCNDNSTQQCVTCSSTNCNTAKTSGASMLGASSAAILLLAALISGKH